MKQHKRGLLERELFFSNASKVQLAMFSKNLALMLKSGLDIIESLEIMRNQATGYFHEVIGGVIETVEAGNSLSYAFKNYPSVFSELFINTTLAGERSGTLAENLENIASDMEKSNEVYLKIRGALVYPVVVVFGAMILGLIMSFVVLPKIIPMFESMNVELPVTTRALIWLTHFMEVNKSFLLVLVFIGLPFAYWLVTRKFAKPVTHYVMLRLPIIGKIIKDYNLSNYCSTFATMLKSGLIIDEALSISCEVVGNHYYKKALTDVYKRTLQGNTLSENLERHADLFPKLVVSMAKVGERSGNLETSLFHLANYYEREIDNSTKNLSTALEPILLIVIGLVVGTLAVSIVTPIYKITNNVAIK